MVKIIPLLSFLLISGCAVKGNQEIRALKQTHGETQRRGSDPIPFQNLVIFACENIPYNKYLFNERHTNVCWIENPKDFETLTRELKTGPLSGQDMVYIKECPLGLNMYKACDPTKLRDF